MKKKVGIFIADSNGGYPVPASRGGAVSILVEHLLLENNKRQLFNMNIISIYDEEAERESEKYKNIRFIWIKPPRICKAMDKWLFNIVRKVMKKKKAVSYKSLFSLIYYICKASKIVRKSNFDKIVLENNIPLAWCLKLSRFKGEYYYHFHNVPRTHAGCKKVFRKCKKIFCVSNFVAGQIEKSSNPIGPIPQEKIHVLYNCIDTEQFIPLLDVTKRKQLRKRYGLEEKDIVICFVGRLSEEKGIDKVLEAVSRIHQKDIKVLIVGSYIHNIHVMDEYQKKLYHLAEKLGENISFTGYIPQNEIHQIYQCSDIAVLPSIWEEPAGLTMLEAYACGLPVITTNSGGIPEYMTGKAVILEKDMDLVTNIIYSINEILERDTRLSECPDVNEYTREQYYINFSDLLGAED